MSAPGTVTSSLEEGAAFASPFAPAALAGREDETYMSADAAAGPLTTPFAESLTTLAEDELEREAFSALAAEFEDDEFTEALEVLVHEAAGRHLRSSVAWSHEGEAASLAAADVEQWLEAIAADADHRLAQLGEHFGDRPVDSVTEAELDAFLGMELERSLPDGPLNAQEFFFKKLWKKAKKVVRGAAKLAKKGIKAVTKLLPVGRIFAVLRRLVRPLLKRVLSRAIGKLPAPLRPAATRLASKFLGGSRRARRREAEFETDEIPDVADLAAEFDEAVAGAILVPDDASMEALLGEFEAAEPVDRGHSVDELAAARQRLAHQLVEAEPGRPPIPEMEQFIPAVMAAMPLIRLGVRVIGRERIVKKLAGLLASLTKDMVGPQIARPLSRHIADAGLRLLGLEAERTEDGMLAAEALVA
ncbi:MAG: hypothetical protein M3O70_03380, partial [Actinomycetota bacterium]|nr:hypothetical protein [Actinomycetota bacterium]